MHSTITLIRRIFVTLTLLVGFVGLATAQDTSPTCNGKFMNPITDVCWSCVFPIKISGVNFFPGGQEDNGSTSSRIFCACGNNGVIKAGVPISFWEPARTVEVVRGPYCFPSLGGLRLDPGIDAPAHTRNVQKSTTKSSFYQVHWYVNPLMFWLEVLIDNGCLEQNVFDLAYLTEVDPLWNDSEMTFILNPDVSLFTSIVAQAACAVDCVAATAGFPLNELFWCAGCQGSMYPLSGWVGSHVGGVQASSLLAQRFTNKMHREGLIWAASGSDGMCGFYPQPLMDKTNYKYQMLYPVRQTEKINGRCCQPYGRTTTIWGAGKEFPYKGEDFSYQVFRKRDCCQGAFP
jgi:conjugal transfer pilus assembly protein TraU